MSIIRFKQALIGCMFFVWLANSAVGQVSLELEFSANTIEVGDPVYVRVCVKNTTEQGIRISKPFINGTGAVQFEAKLEGLPEFEGLELPGQGRLCIGDTGRNLLPKEEWNYYAVLWKDGSGLAFEQPGIYLVRAAFRVNTDRRVTPPVTLKVEAPAENDKGKRRLPKELEAFVGVGYALDLDGNTSELSKAIDEMPLCRLRSSLEWALLLNNLRFGRPTDTNTDSYFAACLKTAKTMDKVSLSVYSLSLARQLIAMKLFRQAESVLARTVQPGEQRNEMLDAIERGRAKERREHSGT